ncbi:TRAP-type C4-dicarboxylate transport system permease small subunit [Tepidamorphus gemmatus]|jgi:TRAP-type C4-dicarboxylate transport system permease small subunit|uniref:TRAP transporter small permease protein n=1 Tax=Tepidamorphus gemmatus TaxID=747076 RepID=A0A4R3MGV5_9HYPH|nr:TRAP transporter small permease [Tepidamorphus gemmatus]TCT11587.1 TRAP-type C4-dicarboxylate transport system permease small subunit [Tepidamorphus gemmatus]
MRGVDLFRRFQRAGTILCGLLLIAFTGLVVYSVASRYLFSAPPMWGEEIPKLLFVWMIFIGAGFAHFSGHNIRMTALIERVPPRPRRIIELVMHGLAVVILLVILWYSVPILQLTARTNSLATGLSDMWTYIALPIGALLLLANEALRIRRLLRGHVDDPVDLGSER